MNDRDIINALPDKPKPLSDSEILGALPDKKDPAKASFELTSAYNPDRTAKVQKLSAQFDKPAPFIDAHLEDAEKAANAPEDKFWTDLKAMYPSTHKWLADPNNMAVAHDDIESLKAFEDKVAHASYLGRLYYGLNSGMASMWSGVSRIPAYAYKVAALPQNAIVTAMGRPDLQVNAPKWLMDNPVAKYYDRNAEAFKTPEMSQSTSQLITEGRYSDAAKTALMGIVANAPQQVPLLLAAASGYGAAGLVGMGALQAAQTSKENQDAGADPLASTMNATLQGTFEAAWERVGTLGIFKSIEANAIRQFGKENGVKFTKELAKEMFLHTAGEGAEEFGTQVSQDWSAKITGVSPDAMTGTLGRAIDAGIIGWGSGITMTAPGAMSSAYGKVLESKQAEATRKAYLAMGSSLEAGKLRARLPEAQRHFVESVTKDGPVENIYLDREPAEVYFQSKGIDPEQAFRKMGATAEAVKLSKETGAPLKISMADWANNVVGTEHYNALADDVAFGPYEPTVRKVNAKKAEVTAALKAIDEQIKTDEVAKTDYEKVHAALKEDQVRLGVKESEADAVAKVAARRMMYLAKAEGKSIDEILGDRPKATSPMEYKYGFDKAGKPLVELTPEEIRDIDVQNQMEVVREMGGVTPIMDAVRSFGGIDYEKVKRDSLGSNMPEANLGAGIYRKGGKSVSEMAGALVHAGKAPEGWDEIELADAIDKEMRESAKFISQYGEGKYKKLRRETLYQAAVEKGGKLLQAAVGNDLVAIHNLSSESLRHADKMGGLAVPSLSISKLEHPLEGFGEISLIGSKDLIDPKRASNKVFNADIYSPRYPNVNYTPDPKKLGEARKFVAQEEKDLDRRLDSDLDSNEFERKGMDAITESPVVRLKYLRSIGKGIEVPKKKVEGNYLKLNPDISKFVDKYALARDLYDNKGFLREYDKLRQAVVEDMRKKSEAAGDSKADTDELVKMESEAWYEDGKPNYNIIKQIQSELIDRQEEGKPDYYAAERAIREAMPSDRTEFETWVNENFGGVIGKERLYNGEDRNYNRRYLPHTLENVVRVMKRELQSGEGFNYGLGNLRASVAKRYRTIKDIQADRDKILNKADFEKAKELTDKEFEEILDEARVAYGKHNSDSNRFGVSDTFVTVLIDGIKAHNLEGDLKEFGFEGVDVERIKAFLDTIRHMPTEYFEAKIQRAVGLNEFSGAVIPAKSPDYVRDILKKNGIPFKEYAKDEDRRKAIVELSSGQASKILFQAALSSDPTLIPDVLFQPAYHGSPYTFDRFALEHIGKGEGAQAYGWGLYFAGDKRVAEFYRETLSDRKATTFVLEGKANSTWEDVRKWAANKFGTEYIDNVVRPAGIAEGVMARLIDGLNWNPYPENSERGKIHDAIVKSLSIDKKSEGKLYEVNIPEDDVLLDWDRPLSEQPRVKLLVGVDSLLVPMKEIYDSDFRDEISKLGVSATPYEDMGEGIYLTTYISPKSGRKIFAYVKISMSGGDGTVQEVAQYDNEQRRELVPCIFSTDGRSLYKSLVESKGSPEAASKFLNSLGIKGIKYLDGNSRNDKGEKVNHNYVIFDDSAIEILNRYYQAAQDNNENARGFYDVVNNLLVRGDKADASTYWHEFSHYYLDRLFKAANSGKASESFVGDWAVIAKWLGVTKDQKELTREQHEQFARGSEAYLRGDDYSIEKMAGGRYSVISAMSGKSLREFKTKAEAEKWIKKNTIKAPSKELKSAFTRFRVWLTKVYKSVRDLNVELPDDVRGVFDKMLAAEDGITEAEKDLGLDKIGEGLNEADASKLKAIHKEAHDEAVELLTRHLLTSVKKSSKEEREKYRRKVEDGMRLKLIEERVYKAIRLMDPDPLKRAQDYIDSKLQPKDGIQVSLTSEMLGYSSGDEMCKDVLAAKPLEVAVKEQTDRIMAAYDESESPEVLKARAEKLVHSDKNVELMALEAMLVRSRIFGREITEAERERGMAEASVEVALTKKAANEILAEMNVVEAANPSSFARMERDAAAKAAAAMAVKDYAKFVIYKRRQRTCHAMYSKSVDIKRRLDKRMTRIDKILKKPLDSFKDQDSFNQIGMLMMRFKFGLLKHWMPDGKGPTLPEYIKQVNGIFSDPLNPGEVSDGILAIPEWIVSGMSKSWRDMSWAEFQDATDAIENLIHAANKVDSFFKIRNKAILSAVGDELTNKAYTSIKNVVVQKVEQSGWDRAKHLLNDYLYRLDGVDALTQRLDGYEDGGIWQQIFLDPMREQAGLEDKKMREMRDALKGLWAKCYTPEEAKELFTKQAFYDDLKASMTKSKVLAMALNMGALENRAKLFSNPITGTFPDAWNEEAVNRFLEQNLTSKDCEFVQGVWDIINSLWPDVAAMQEDLTGFEPLKVEAVPFTLNLAEGKAFQFRGGYFPLKADPNANNKAGEKAFQREIADEPLYTEQSHTKKRTGANYTLLMDLGLIDRHVRDVVHDLYFRGLVFDLRRLLARENVQMAVKSTLGPEAYRALLQHVNSYATGANAEKLSSNGLDVVIRWVNQRVSRVVIVGKVSVIAQNLANVMLAGNAVEGFSHWDAAKAILFRGIGGYWRPGAFYQAERNKTLQFVWERSEFMRAKRMSPDYSLNDIKEGKLDDHQTVKEFFLGLMAGTDDLTNVPVWLEMYHKRIKEGANEEQAIKEADLLVSRISGSGRKYDQALITKGSDLERLFAKFYTFWNIEYANWLRNLNQFERDKIKNAPRFAGFVASRMVFIWASAMLVGGAPGDDEDKKKAWWWKQYLTYPLSFFPVLRDLAAAPINELVGLPSYGYRAAPVFSMPSTWVKSLSDISKWAHGDKETDKMLESVTKSAAYVGGYPDQFNTWFWNAYDAAFNDMELRPQDVMVRRPAKER